MTQTGREINSLKRPGRSSVARVLEIVDGVVWVDLDDGRVSCMVAIGYAPTPGDYVLVERTATVSVITMAFSPTVHPPVGTVSATTTTTPNTVEVTDGYGAVRVMPYMGTYTPTIGDQVAVVWPDSVGLVLGLRGTVAAPDPGHYDPPPPIGAPNPFTVAAIDAGTYRGGWYSGEVIQGSYGYGEEYGSWFYGGQIAQALTGVTVTSAAIYLPRVRGGANYGPGEPAHLYRHSSDFRPGGDVVRVDGPFDAGPVPLGAGWYAISPTLAQLLIDGGGGVGIAGGPYMKFASRSENPQTGTLSIAWN